MFILRHVPKGGAPINTILGNFYKVVMYQGNEDQFQEQADSYWDCPKVIPAEKRYEEGYYAFLVSEKTTIPLKHGYNYIMTDSGKTFENISNFPLSSLTNS